MKKTLLLIALSICSTFLTIGNVKAAEKVSDKYHYEVLDEQQKTATLTKVDDALEEVVIPSKIDGYQIVQLGTMKGNSYSNPNYQEEKDGRVAIFSKEDAKKITHIALPKELTKIGVQALRDCERLKNVTLPANLTHIGEEAFMNCRAITSITIPKKVKGIGYGAFERCTSMEKVVFKTSKAKIGSDAFATDDGIYHEDVKGGKGSHLKKIVMPYTYKGLLKKRAFSGYVGTTFTWRNFNTYNEGFLAGCRTLKKIVFPKKLKVIDIPSHCFDDSLSTLKSLVIPSKVKKVYVEQQIRNIKSITIKGMKTAIKGSGMSKNMISVNTVKCKKNSTAWYLLRKYVCPDFSKKFKKEIETDEVYTKKNVHTKKVNVKSWK